MTDSEKLDLLLSEMQGVKSEMQDMKSEIQELRQHTASIESDVTDIKLTLENEIRVNIQRVAEGHLDLSRNMHEVMKPNNEIEMLAIKVRMLETDVRELKQKMA
ncbi:MAG: hypothetical protein K2J60_04900 [Acetatifactor sp.]|nr:hypothetical protein [Acetatifactor sp.]